MPSDSTAGVIVTAAGGAAGVAVVRALQSRGRHVIGCDADELAAGIRLADVGAVVPPYRDPCYVTELCRLAEKTGASVLVSTIAEEMPILHAEGRDLAAAGLVMWLPPVDAVRNCVDKWAFAQVLADAGVPAPTTALGHADGVPSPWIVKPRFGRGSRDVYAVADEDQLRYALARVPDPIVQTLVSGREFTVDALIDRDGSLAGAVPRWRLETKAGISVKGETFVDQDLVSETEKVLRAVGLTGPVNVQGFVLPTGDLQFIEVNPRFSGALPLSLAAGADLVGEYLRAVEGGTIRRERLVHRGGVRMIRFFEELFEE